MDAPAVLTTPREAAPTDPAGPGTPPPPLICPPPHPRISGTAAGWLAALLGWTTLLSFFHLQGGAGFEPTDAWVAQTAREMAERGDLRGWVVPTFCGEVRAQKSPGPYWAVVLAAKLRGTPVDEVATRIPNAIAAVLLVVTVFWLTRRIAGDRAAIFAGLATSSCAMLLYWSHRGASDLGVTTLMTIALAALWVGSECEPPGRRQVALWLLGYFAAGLAMLYKMPMPLVCIGLPALLYVLLLNRWRILASGWHLVGLLLFLLPWLPWAVAFVQFEPRALFKWRVEFFDRFTGDLPNVAEQQSDWRLYFLYLGAAFVFALPYSLSIPQTIVNAFRRRAELHRRGAWFLLIWLLSLLAFFTAASGKETRYFLPAMPPLLMLLGIELARFFDPQRRPTPALDRLGLRSVWLLVPAGIAAGFYGLHHAWTKNTQLGLPPWSEVWPPLAVAAAIFALGAMLSAWLYSHRREHASFGALVGTMWATWLWAWPQVMPVLVSQAAFKDFAAQLRELPLEQRAGLQQIAQQDPRIIWYSDVRFGRLLDPLELLERQGGRRNLAFEKEHYARRMIAALEGKQPVLLVASPQDYIEFQAIAPVELAREGRAMPPSYVWRVARVGRLDHRYVLFGNHAPPSPAPDTAWLEARVEKARRAYEERGEQARTPVALGSNAAGGDPGPSSPE